MANADSRITLDDVDWLYDKIGITVLCFVENAVAALEILKYSICRIDDSIIVERPLYRSGSSQIVF